MDGLITRPLRLLTFSTLFPNCEQQNHGIFVENRLCHLLDGHGVQSTVVAPVPLVPLRLSGTGAWSRYSRVPAREERRGLVIHHPRFPAIPRVGMAVSPMLLFASAAAAIRRLMAHGLEFDAIDAHYFYPDGVAAVWLGRLFGKPVVVTARGSDITQFPGYAVPRRLIQGAIRHAAGIITVSAALKDALVGLGAAPHAVTVLRNGVDLDNFHPHDRDAARRVFGLTRPTLLSVGHLIERKGHHLAIAAMPDLPGYDLVIAGEGPERNALLQQIAALGLQDRVRLLGALPHAQLPELYSAADALVLASSREGWANVLLEAMACGTPVVASDIPGMAEVVQARPAGLLTPRTAAGIADGVHALFANPPSRTATRRYAEDFSWHDTSRGQANIFRRLVAA